jgi:gp178
MKRYIEFIDNAKTSAVEQLNIFLENLSKGSIHKVAGYQANTDCTYILLEVENELANQLDEPQPVKVPQCVADWYEENKDDFETSLFQCIYELFEKRDDSELNEFEYWVIDGNTKPFQTLVNMHQFGYEVEEEKRYRVKIKGNIKENMLVYGELLERYYFTKSFSLNNAIYSHTRKELEEAGFGWVFDCQGIEIEEVE